MSRLSDIISGRPEGAIHVIRQLSSQCSKDGAYYSFLAGGRNAPCRFFMMLRQRRAFLSGISVI